MDEKNFIDDVIRELKRRLSLAEETSLGNKRTAAVIGSLKESERRILEQTYRLISPKEVESDSILILAELSLTLLGEISLGLPISREAEIVLEFLLEGKEVYAVESGIVYRKYRDTSLKNLYLVYQDYEKRIVRYGVRIMDNILDILLDEKPLHTENTRMQDTLVPDKILLDGFDLTRQKLIRESDLQKAKSRGFAAVSVGKDAIITPLAGDYITYHNLSVKRIN